MFTDFIYLRGISASTALQEDRDLYILFTSSPVPKASLLNNMNGSPIVHWERRQEKGREDESRGQDEREKKKNCQWTIPDVWEDQETLKNKDASIEF